MHRHTHPAGPKGDELLYNRGWTERTRGRKHPPASALRGSNAYEACPPTHSYIQNAGRRPRTNWTSLRPTYSMCRPSAGSLRSPAAIE